MKIGFSFGRCIRDIVNGVVNINDVAVIICRTYGIDADNMDDVINQYLYQPDYLDGLAFEDCMKVGLALLKNGQLHQPRNFGTTPIRVPSAFVWMDLAPTNFEQDDSVKEAWENYQIMLKLVTSGTPDVENAPFPNKAYDN